MTRHDLCIYEGETYKHTFPELRDDSDNLIDLTTGYSVVIHVKEHPLDTSKIDEWLDGSEVTLNSDGTIDLELSSSTTKGYDFSEVVYDLRLEDPSGDISFPFYGHIELDHAVTVT